MIDGPFVLLETSLMTALIRWLWVDGRLLVGRRVDEQLLLELRWDLQLPDLEVATVAVHFDLGVGRRAGRLLVGRKERVLERLHQLLMRNVLLCGEAAYGFN